MEYTILNTTLTDDTIYTLVRYNIEGNIIEVNIPHFMPQDYSILEGVSNRYTTEMYKIFPDRMPPIPVYVEPVIEEPVIDENIIEENE